MSEAPSPRKGRRLRPCAPRGAASERGAEAVRLEEERAERDGKGSKPAVPSHVTGRPLKKMTGLFCSAGRAEPGRGLSAERAARLHKKQLPVLSTIPERCCQNVGDHSAPRPSGGGVVHRLRGGR